MPRPLFMLATVWNRRHTYVNDDCHTVRQWEVAAEFALHHIEVLVSARKTEETTIRGNRPGSPPVVRGLTIQCQALLFLPQFGTGNFKYV